jgi:RNA polymerase sigma factor (sigma-70 family)
MHESGSSMTPNASNFDNVRERVLEHYRLLDRLAKRRFHDPNVADEALDYIFEALEAKDWAKVRAFRGQCLLSTFLCHIAVRLLEDFGRKMFGRKRPPDWIKCHGSLWEEVYRLLCVERMGRVDVVETLTILKNKARSRRIVEEAVDVILSRVSDCGDRRGETVSMDFRDGAEWILKDSTHKCLSPEEFHMAHQRVSIIEALGHCLTSAEGTEESNLPGEEMIRRMVLAVSAHLKLTSEDRLLLRMVYRDGLSTSAAGRRLGLGTYQVHGRLRRMLERIRKAFQKSGLYEELRLLLTESE